VNANPRIPLADTFSAENVRNCERYVISMQKRLDEAVANNDHNGIRRLFNILARRSRAVRILAIYRITYKNQGKNTAGVDGMAMPKDTREKTDYIRRKLLDEINIRKIPNNIRRVYIPKANGKKRPLGIPTIQDRIIQEIIRIALEPIAEYHFHHNSYGFRPKRSCHDAIEHIRTFLTQSDRKRYIVEGDIKGCFDHISHDHIITILRKWLLPEYAISIIEKMLKSGVIENGRLHEVKEGTPQGGVISPLLTNIALTSFDNHISKRFGKISYHGGKHTISPMIRYADDFVIVCRSKLQAKMVKEECRKFLLTEIGLTLSDEKTRITHIKRGFEFLGFKLKKYLKSGIQTPKSIADYTYYATPTKESVINILRSCKEVLDQNKATPQEAVIKLLNSKLQGWGYYYKFANSQKAFSKIDNAMWQKTKRWSKRRHNNKSGKWIIHNLYETSGNTLHFAVGDLKLIRIGSIPIQRYVKVLRDKRVYCKSHADYWQKREKMRLNRKLYYRHKTLYQKQNGQCPLCKAHFAFDDNFEIDHIIPKSAGGGNEQSNLRLLHAECHRDYHRKTR